MRVRFPGDDETFPSGLAQRDLHAGHRGVALEEKTAGQRAKSFGVFDRVALGQDVHRVLHGIGGQHQRIVAFQKADGEFSLGQHIHAQLVEVVRTAGLAHDLCHPDSRLAVTACAQTVLGFRRRPGFCFISLVIHGVLYILPWCPWRSK